MRIGHSLTTVAAALAIFTLALAAMPAAAAAEGPASQEFTFKVRQDRLIGDRDGTLTLAAEKVEYRSEDGKHGGAWAYRDIERFEILSPTRVRITTYEDTKLFGMDRAFTLEIIGGALTVEVSDFLRRRIARPFVTVFTVEAERVLAEIPAKHNHRFGGCQGTLRVFGDHLVYDSDDDHDSRSWRWTDLRMVSRVDPYQFEVLTYEREFGGPARSYTFALKEPMADAVFDIIWTNVYRPSPLRLTGPLDPVGPRGGPRDEGAGDAEGPTGRRATLSAPSGQRPSIA
jgi:hypothetical protein